MFIRKRITGIYQRRNLCKLEKRDFLSVLSQYYVSSYRRVHGISGLRGTDKTVGILQSLVGLRNYDKVNGKEIIYIGMDSLLSNYYSFSANKATILEEIKEDGRKSYFEEKNESSSSAKSISNSDFEIHF